MTNKKNKNYKIFRVEVKYHKGRKFKYAWPKKIVMQYIYAKDDKDAYNQLKKYRKIANKEYTYYVEPYVTYHVIGDDETYDLDTLLSGRRNKMPWYKRILEDVSFNLHYYFVDKPKDIYYRAYDIWYLLKNKHQHFESWNIDRALIDTLHFNIKKLKNKKYSLSWAMLDKAILEKHKDDPNFDLKQFHKEHCSGYGNEIEKRAIELEKELFDKLISDICAYKYYTDWYDNINELDDEQVATEKRLKHTLPLIKGSYDRYDYIKLNELSTKYWNRIWETTRIYGREFVD
jgi:hypothetical protein